MPDSIRVIGFYSWSLGIFYGDIAVGMIFGKFAYPLVDESCIFFISVIGIQFHSLNNGGVTPAARQLPVYLHNCTVYLDAQEILWFSRNGKGCFEGDLTLDAAHSAMTDERVAGPRTIVRPCDAICIFHGFHQLRYSVVIIRLSLLSIFRFLYGLFGLDDDVIGVVKLRL